MYRSEPFTGLRCSSGLFKSARGEILKANPQLSQSTIFRIRRFRRILAIPVSLLALFVCMTVLLLSDTAIYAQQNGVGQTGQSGKQQIPVSRGNASQRG